MMYIYDPTKSPEYEELEEFIQNPSFKTTFKFFLRDKQIQEAIKIDDWDYVFHTWTNDGWLNSDGFSCEVLAFALWKLDIDFMKGITDPTEYSMGDGLLVK